MSEPEQAAAPPPPDDFFSDDVSDEALLAACQKAGEPDCVASYEFMSERNATQNIAQPAAQHSYHNAT